MKMYAADLYTGQPTMLTAMQRLQAQYDQRSIAPGENDSQFSAISFSQLFTQAINHVDAIQQQANAKVDAVDSGASDDLADAMIASQKADVAFSALLQIRNKLSSALDEVMNIAL